MVKLPGIFLNGEENNTEQRTEQQSGGLVLRPMSSKETEELKAELLKRTEEAKQKAADLEAEIRQYKQSRINYSNLCVERQKYIQLSDLERSALIKGMNSGKDLQSLFLEACKIVSDMTEDKVIYEYARRYISGLETEQK